MSDYRFTLGRERDATNLVTNGTFDTDLSGWTASNFVWNAASGGVAENPTNGTAGRLTQSGVFTEGKYYEIDFEVKQTAGVNVGVTCGDYYRDLNAYTVSTHTISRFAVSGTDLLFRVGGDFGTAFYLDNVEAYEMIWKSPLTDEPIGWDEAKFSLKRDRVTQGIFARYIADLTFHGDGWSYLSALAADDICAEVPVRIEKRCNDSDDYEDYFIGTIFLSECEFDYKRCQVKCTIEDGLSRRFLNSQDVKVFFNIGQGIYLRELPNAVTSISLHDNTGTYSYYRNLSNVFTSLQTIILYATNLTFDLDSDYFGSGGTFENLYMGMGSEIRSSSPFSIADDAALSFNDFFTELSKVFNLSFRPIYDGDVPKIKVEQKEDFFNASNLLTLSNVASPILSYDIENYYRAVNIGYKKVLNNDESGGHAYYSDVTCNDEELELVSSFVQDSEIIEDLLDGTITDTEYDNDIVLVETNGTQSINTGAPDYLYNPNTNPSDNMTRWVESLNTDYYRDVANTSVREEITKSNSARVKIWQFDYPISDSEWDTILTNPIGKITFDSPENNVSSTEGWILEAERNEKTTLTNFKLITT